MDNGRNHLREFGNFRLDVERQVLWYDEEPVNLPLKEIELLVALTDNAGEVVTKRELMDSVWEDSFVEESNLSRHIYRLRKIFEELGETEEMIQTVPRRGYRFTGRVNRADGSEVVIERHSLTRTVIQEIERSEEPELVSLPATRSQVRLRSLILPGTLILLAATAVFVGFRYGSGSAVPIAESTIAVLPLKSVSGEVDDALGLGFADALITTLGGIDNMRVLSRSTVSSYTGQAFEPLAEGRRLGVDYIIDGTLQNANRKIRVPLRLTRVSDGTQLWSGNFDESETEIFKLQDAMAEQTLRALDLNLDLKDREGVIGRYTSNAEAYQAYLKGRFLFAQVRHERAAGEFRRALAIDPAYALAHAGLSDSLARLANSSAGNKRAGLYEEARLHAEQSLAIDPNLAEGHAAMGWLLRIYDWNWKDSESHIRQRRRI